MSFWRTPRGRLPFMVFLPFYGQGRCPTHLISPASPPKPEPLNFLTQVQPHPTGCNHETRGQTLREKMLIHNQNLQDLLGNVVQDALANVLDSRLRALEAQIPNKVASTEAGLNELRIGHLRSEMTPKIHDFPHFSGRPSENLEEWDKKLEKQMLLKGLKIDDNALKLIFLEFRLEGDAL
uniref:Uncharacterized protein n=1 Tax=Romanomermis culicivorax TaxID=13658 RepID=A0A915IBJ1_ROMCU